MTKGLFHSRYLSALYLVVFLIVSCHVAARPVSRGQAENASRGWLRKNQRPMGQRISKQLNEAATYTDETGRPLYYVIELAPEGFVVMSADDEIEPVIAFSATGYFVDDEQNPLKVMLSKDMKGRLAAVEAKVQKQSKAQRKSSKWQSLQDTANLKTDDESTFNALSAASVSDVYVDPFLQTVWDQSDVLNSPCYNYYTPNNYVVGCVATAMAQLMRHYSWPITGIGVHEFSIQVDNNDPVNDPITADTRGGNGAGGPYNWAQMPYDPQSGVTATQRQAIGAICHDAAVTVGMSFTSGASSASLFDGDAQLVDTFMYSNSIYSQNFSSSGDDQLWDMMNTNLDAQMPVILGISRAGGGHAVVADGYGYTNSTMYHHINMGWGGTDNAWYQLPVIDAYYTYTFLDDCIFNVYTSGSGEIVSGRVTNLAGAPLAGATVTARNGTTIIKQTTTDSRGVYALTKLPSNTTYKVSVSKSGENFLDQNVSVGRSSDWSTAGNRWGINFVSAMVGPPTVFDIEVDVDSTVTANIHLQALDDGDPDPNLLTYIITSLPSHGVLSEPNVGLIETIPYTIIVSDANGVNYTPCPYFGGQDTFTYKANDGGTYPIGGDSNMATVTVNVNNEKTTDYHSESNSYSRGILDTGDYAVRSQLIYLSSEMGASKRMTDLGIRVNTVPGRTLNNFTIRMRHTTLNVYTNLQQIYDDWTTVYQSNETLTSGWNWFGFDSPFDYNGSDNLMIDISFWNNGTASDGYYYIYDVGQNRNYIMFDTNNDAGSPLDWDYYSYWDTYSQNSYMPVMQFISVSPVDPMDGDFDATCDVKLPDLAIFSQAWDTQSGDAEYNADCDLSAVKGAVNILDLAIFSDQWLQKYAY